MTTNQSKRLINVEDVGVNFPDKLKFKNYSIYGPKKGVYWIFSDNEHKHKNLHHNFDDDGLLNI